MGFIPLAALAFWAYAPASPYDYPTLTDLLLSSYTTAAQPGDPTAMLIRAGALLFLAVLLTGLLLWQCKQQRAASSLLAGACGAFLLTQPSLVPWVLQGNAQSGWIALVGVFTGAGVLVVAVQRLPACAVPLILLIFLGGIGTAVAAASAALLRSNPPLFVLEQATRQPQMPAAQMALGMHLLSIGGMQAASPHFRLAGQQLLSTVDPQQQPEVYAAAERLVELTEAPQNSVDEIQMSDHEESNRP